MSDPAYAAVAALVVADAEFAIADDDTAGFTFTPATPTPAVDEAGATSATYELSIDTIPGSDVTVDFAATGSDATVSPASHTFTSVNYATPVTITVTAIDDGDIEGDHTDTITHVVNASSDPLYVAAPPIAGVTVDVADDDAAEVIVNELGGVAVNEAGATTDTFEVRLDATPSEDVVIDVSFDPAQMQSPTPSQLTFTPTNWMTPQIVTVRPVDDGLIEGPHTSQVAFTISAYGPEYDPAFVTVAPVDVAIADDDVAGVIVTDPTPMTLDEADAVGTERIINVRLAANPATPVNITAGNNGQVQFMSSPDLVLDSGNWNTGVNLPVRAVDDLVAEADPHPGVVSFTVLPSSDPAFTTPPLTITPRTFQVADDDAALAMIECQPGADWTLNGAGRLQMDEAVGAPTKDVTCNVQLATEAAQDVVVDVTTTVGQLSVDRASVTIPAGAQGPEPLVFTAVTDAIAEGTHAARIDFNVTSTDPIYDAKTIAGLDVDIADDDTVGVTVTPTTPIPLTEGGSTQTFTVVLNSQPTATTTITATGDAQVGATPATLEFLPANWNVPQTVTVTAVDDPYDEPDGHPGIVALAATGNAAYAALVIPAVNVTITDNDTPGVVVSLTDAGNAVTEGGATDKLSLQLGTAPSSDVTVNVVGDANVSTGPTSVIFTPTTWNVAQEVTLTAIQDPVVEGEHQANVTFALSSSDVSYITGSAVTPLAQPVTVTDDDVAGIVVVETGGKTILTEAGATDTYTVALLAQPTADVTVAVDGGAQVTPTPATLTFTPANWSTPQGVTATAVQDMIDEADPHPGNIVHSITTTAAGWANANVAGVVASITDDDVAEIIATQTEGLTKVLEGAETGDTITFQLKSQPTKDVSIVPTGDAQLTVSNAPIVLTTAAWDKPVTLKVEAVDDEEVEGDHQGLITFAVSSEDAIYARATVASISAAVGDNDVDSEVPTVDEDEDATGRTPLGSTPPVTVRPRGTTDAARPNRTDAGEDRTASGRDRTDAGFGTDSDTEEVGVSTSRRLLGELSADEEELKVEPTPADKAKAWLQKRWKTLLPLLLLAGALVGTAMYVLRSNPVKRAKRASAKAAKAKGSTGAVGKRNLRAKKKKRKDEKDDAGGKPKRKR